jgi:hypothetical protein
MNFPVILEELKNSQVKTNKYIGITEGTIKTYIAKIKFIEKNAGDVPFNEFINTFYTNENTKSAYQVAVIGVAKHSPSFKEFIGEETLNATIADNEKLMESLRGNPKQDKTEKEIENWINLKDLKKMAKDRKDEFSIQDQILIACYTLMPPVRLDLHDILIVRTAFIDPETGRPENVAEKQNYLRIYKQKSRPYSHLVLNEYKTERTYGQFNERFPKAITDLIFQLPATQTHLFQTKGSNGAFSSPETFGVYLRAVFKKLTGKNISVDLLRHIYLTNFRKGEKTTENKQKVAKKMMNSVAEQENYLRKAEPSSQTI